MGFNLPNSLFIKIFAKYEIVMILINENKALLIFLMTYFQNSIPINFNL